jgi:hypothetical protein
MWIPVIFSLSERAFLRDGACRLLNNEEAITIPFLLPCDLMTDSAS